MPRSKENDRIYQRQHYQECRDDPEFRAKRREAQEKHYAAKRQIVADARTPCIICGESEPCCIDFHHVRGEKQFQIASYRLRNITALQEELDKCVCLCANCHRKHHAGLLPLNT